MSTFGSPAAVSATTASSADSMSGTGVTATPEAPPKRRRGRPPKKSQPILADNVAGMLAAGVTPAQIATTLHVSKDRIVKLERDPAVLEKIQVMRDALREVNMHGLHAHTARAYAMLGQMIDQGDAKGFQLTANGLANMERTAASTAGDARRVEAAMQIDADVTAEAQALLLALIGTSG